MINSQKEHSHSSRTDKHPEKHAEKSVEKVVAATAVEKGNGAEPSRQRVLIAEDNEDTRRTLKSMLELALGVEVDTVGDGAQALQALIDTPYSVVITDIKMPRVSGMQLIEEVSQRRLP